VPGFAVIEALLFPVAAVAESMALPKKQPGKRKPKRDRCG